MPVIFLHGPKMDKEKKAQLAKIFTESTSEATGIPKESIVVYFKETDPENVSSGGVLVADKRKS